MKDEKLNTHDKSEKQAVPNVIRSKQNETTPAEKPLATQTK